MVSALLMLCVAPFQQAPASTDGFKSPVHVQVGKEGGGWKLYRNGTHYVIKGAGGSSELQRLKALGGNSIRTWGSDNQKALLDESHKLGISVTLGYWMGHARHGFSYEDPKQVADQQAKFEAAVKEYRSHPAVLMWAVGNEMELGQADDGNPNLWKAVEAAAAAAKKLDPSRPTMTVLAELGTNKISAINRLCPSIDIIGLNSYGGAASIVKRYRDQGGKKPIILTEFGPNGQWEVAKTDWGAPMELTSTQKADAYRNAYQKFVTDNPDLALGSYAFLWGNKQEATATWYGMLLPDGTPVAAAEAMGEIWSGRKPANRVPVIEKFEVVGSPKVSPGGEVRVALTAKDPDGDPLKAEWKLLTESTEAGVGGDAEKVQEQVNGAVVQSSLTGATLKMPTYERGYRIFVYLRDGKSGAAVANIPLLVEDPKRVTKGAPKQAPVWVYRDTETVNNWIPSGHMGATENIYNQIDARAAGREGTVIRAGVKPNSQWAGVVWQSPEGDWGDKDGGFNIIGAKKLSFWAKGLAGGEQVKFEFGILARTAKFYDTANGSMTVTLTKDWKEYSFDLTGKDLSRIKTGFCWVVAPPPQGVTFYLDDIRYE